MIRRPPRSTRMTHSFPTRRSSDLRVPRRHPGHPAAGAGARAQLAVLRRGAGRRPGAVAASVLVLRRSEEHTSELQSLMRISYAVFCLKKKNLKIHKKYITLTIILNYQSQNTSKTTKHKTHN